MQGGVSPVWLIVMGAGMRYDCWVADDMSLLVNIIQGWLCCLYGLNEFIIPKDCWGTSKVVDLLK